MRIKQTLLLGVAVAAAAAYLTITPLNAQVTIDADDIGGVVTGPAGPEAGVWVIAETTDLGTKMAKMVVTDDQGRYVIPDLPKAKYKVWVRGYGLVDSAKVDSEPGKQLNLTAVKAPDEKAAAEYYPAIYWYSMIKVPEAVDVPGHRTDRQRHQPERQEPGPVPRHHQDQWLCRLPPAWQQGDAYRSRRCSASSRAGMRRGHAASSPARPRLRWSPIRNAWARRLRCACWATGPTASPRASCRRRSRNGRRASSATPSSRCGTGRTRRPTCTTRRRATSATRPSTPTG